MSKKQYECFKCHQVIFFHEGQVNKWGKPQQFNADGTEHWTTCPAREQKGQKHQSTGYAGTGAGYPQHVQQQGGGGKVFYSQDRRPPVPQPNVDKGIELQLAVIADELKALKDRVTVLENKQQQSAAAPPPAAAIQQQDSSSTTNIESSVEQYTPSEDQYEEGEY